MGITGRGKIGSSNDINSGEYTAPESKGSLGFDFDTPRIGNPSNSIQDSITGSGPKSPKSSIGLGIGASPTGNLGLGLEIPLPVAAPVSARAGVSIDPATGEIRGGYGGLGIGKGPIGASVDVGVDTPKGSEDFGCFKYVTFNVGPFSHTVSKNECEPKPPKQPSETSAPSSLPPEQPETRRPPPGGISIDSVRGCTLKVSWREVHKLIDPYSLGCGYILAYGGGYPYRSQRPDKVTIVTRTCREESRPADQYGPTPFTLFGESVFDCEKYWVISLSASQQYLNDVLGFIYFYIIPTSFVSYNRSYELPIVSQRIVNEPFITVFDCNPTKPNGNIYTPRNLLLLSLPYSSSSLPNPPPTKKKMDDKCCKILIQLQLETLRLLGRQLGPNGVMAQSKEKGFIGEEIERTLTPIDNPDNPEKVKVRFTTVYQMLMYALKQGIALDTALDPQSYKVPTGKLQNPAYSRDSEHSLKSNDQPNKDKAGNSRELEINKDDAVKMSGFLQQQSYMFKMLQRLEYLFPPGELKDAFIAKSLLIPGAKGDIKIHNMIMAYEVQMQYLDAALGNPREILTIKDANPAIEGDQPIEIQSLSISDLLRQNIKFHIDTGGDVDALVNLVLRDFRTNLANRLDQIKTAEMVQALFEDSGMLEKQEYVDVHLEGDPYAGQWVKGQGFKANPDLEKKTEESTEKVLRETMKPTEQRVKVSRRHKDEKTDMRDLLRGLADFVQRLLSIPSAGDAGKSIDQLVESAKFKIQTDMALIRQNVTQAAAASRNRTRKRKK